jgi:hypothetical protein
MMHECTLTAPILIEDGVRSFMSFSVFTRWYLRVP